MSKFIFGVALTLLVQITSFGQNSVDPEATSVELFMIANDMLKTGDERQAQVHEIIKESESLGNRNSSYMLGIFCLKGIGTPQDNNKAKEYLEKAANQGLFQAQLLLAKELQTGNHFKKDLEKSQYWFDKAVSNADAFMFHTPDKLGGFNRILSKL